MKTHRMFELVKGLGAAKSQQDVEKAMAFQHEEMVLRTPAFGSVVKGKRDNAAALTSFFEWFPDYQVDIQGYSGDGEHLTVWGRVHMTWTGHFLGVTPNGNCADLAVFMQFTFKDDLIASELFFIDLSELCAQSGVSTDTVREHIFGEKAAA